MYNSLVSLFFPLSLLKLQTSPSSPGVWGNQRYFYEQTQKRYIFFPLVLHSYVSVWEMCSSCGPRKKGLAFADFLPFSDQMTWCHISMFLSIILKLCCIYIIILIIYIHSFWEIIFLRFYSKLDSRSS